MKPNFALSLSFDGISLLQRVPGGWVHVNDVALDAADLGADMAALRAQADAIAPDGGMVKVVLPNEQIKFLSIADPSADPETRLAAVKAALDGATPYAVQDLSFDWAPQNGQIKIAAVALETLAEAEGFTTSHHFDPVCFVAAAEGDAFDGEVFFGAAEAWISRGGPEPVRDDAAVRIVEAPVADPEPETVDDQPAPLELMPDDAVDDTPAPQELRKPAEPQPLVDPAQEKPKPAPAFASSRRARDVHAAADPKPAEAQPAEKRSAAPRLSFGAKPSVEAPQVPQPGEFRDKPKLEVPRPKIEGVTAPELPKDATKRKAKKPKGKKGGGLFGARRKEAEKPLAPAPRPKVTKVQTPVPPAVAARLATAKAAHAGEDIAPVIAPKAGGQAPTLTKSAEERQRMALFGTREAQAARIGGKPRFLGLILTTALLLTLAGVAAWASVYLDEGLARFFPSAQEENAVAGLPDVPDIDTENPQELAAAPIEVAALDPDIDEGAVSDALTPLAPAPVVQQISEAEAEATYAATGIWAMSPDAPSAPRLESIVGFYEASIDPDVLQVDAIALPQVALLNPDAGIAKQASPVVRGTVFDLDERGLVRATLEGALNPDGVRVYAGLPPVVPPLRDNSVSVAPDAVEQALVLARLEEVRPRVRPSALLEASERATLGGLSRAELANRRPLARPVSETEKLEDEASLQATRLAVTNSLKPITRPKNFAAVVDQAESVKVAALQAPVQPKIPSSASVAKQATVENAISLSRVNLIGVYGKPESRRALVRLSNGKYKKVQVGDKLDGGQVAAIGETELRYVKKGRNLVLEMPKG